MSQVLVIYSSRSGSTKLLAEAVGDGAREAGAEVAVQSVSETTNEDLVAADAIAAGSPVYFGSMSAEMKALWDKSVAVREKLADKVGAAFATSGHPTGGKETTILSIIQAMLIHQMVVIGDPLSSGGHYGVACLSNPREKDLAAGKALGLRLAQVADRMTSD